MRKVGDANTDNVALRCKAQRHVALVSVMRTSPGTRVDAVSNSGSRCSATIFHTDGERGFRIHWVDGEPVREPFNERRATEAGFEGGFYNSP